MELAHQAGKLALSNDFYEIKHFVKKIGSNRRILDKKVLLDVEPPFALVSAYRTGRGSQKAVAGVDGGDKRKRREGKNPTRLIMS